MYLFRIHKCTLLFILREKVTLVKEILLEKQIEFTKRIVVQGGKKFDDMSKQTVMDGIKFKPK